ncbi:hypothetical protein JXA40_05975 [bacterium]|nr:hypothetical protein [candidate division CSSED10-310 bacterium]
MNTLASLWFLYFIILAILPAPLLASDSNSDDYSIVQDVVAQGGHEAVSANYGNMSSAGQQSTVGIQGAGTYENQGGFWHTVLLVPPVPALSLSSILILLGAVSFLFIRKKHLGNGGA